MQILYGREYHRAAEDPLSSGLTPEDSRRCVRAVEKFLENPRLSGLNCEKLGSRTGSNHWSIRASQELRVILALEPNHIEPQRVGLLNMGHHDPMYDWAERRSYHTDLDEYGLLATYPESATARGTASPPEDFAEWILYLPKQQRGLVNRHYETKVKGVCGVARIRGAAGTGKTVVALHRALVLGRLDTSRFERKGRGKGFHRRYREIAWNLHDEWNQEMALRGTVDFADRLLRARDRARTLARPRYRAVIVDEAQDMTQVGIELVRALIEGSGKDELRKDSVLILDDNAQRIYPGGWIPRWVGFEIGSANSDTLKINYRNASRIFEAARAMRGEVADPEEEPVPSGFERAKGERPVLAVVPYKESKVILERIRHLQREGFTDNEIGILVLHNQDVDALINLLKRRGISCMNLKDLRDGQIVPGIRVGTFDRGKGLEFRAVLIPRLGKSRFPLNREKPTQAQTVMKVMESTPGSTEEHEQEREEYERNLNRLYVAMTRARPAVPHCRRRALRGNRPACPSLPCDVPFRNGVAIRTDPAVNTLRPQPGSRGQVSASYGLTVHLEARASGHEGGLAESLHAGAPDGADHQRGRRGRREGHLRHFRSPSRQCGIPACGSVVDRYTALAGDRFPASRPRSRT